jgi:hypothetical protein
MSQSKVRAIKGKTDEKAEKDLRIVERFRLASDESGHEYAIPVYMTDDFYKWVEATENGAETDLDFDKYRVEGMLTFTDPQGYSD